MSQNELNLNYMMILEIKCFQHCKANERYLCLELPEKCPTCLHNLNSKIKFKVPPFILPRTLKLTDTRLRGLPPYSLLLQPTDCDYLKLVEEPDISDLHIGVTNSDSDVFDFNHNGLNKNAHNWIDTHSIIIDIYSFQNKLKGYNYGEFFYLNNSNKTSDDIYVDSKWNTLLDRHWKKRKELWNRTFYNENKFNCLDFIITFLLDYGFFDFSIEHNELILKNDLIDESFKTIYKKNYNILKCFYKKKLSKEYIEPEFLKCLKYLKLLINLHLKKYLREQI